MKINKQIRLWFFIILLPLVVRSQDTIYYNQNSTTTGTVLNILPTKVMCLKKVKIGRDEVFSIDKSTVDRIRFQTGEIHYFNRGWENQPAAESTPRLLLLKDRLYYYGERVHDSTMKKVIMLHPDRSRIPLMVGDYQKMIKYKKIQQRVGVGGIVISGALAGYAFADFFLSTLSGNSLSQTSIVFIGVSAAVLAVTLPVSIHFKEKRLMKKRQIIEQFNAE